MTRSGISNRLEPCAFGITKCIIQCLFNALITKLDPLVTLANFERIRMQIIMQVHEMGWRNLKWTSSLN